MDLTFRNRKLPGAFVVERAPLVITRNTWHLYLIIHRPSGSVTTFTVDSFFSKSVKDSQLLYVARERVRRHDQSGRFQHDEDLVWIR